MATAVGNAVQAVDPGALIIVEPGDASYAREGDLTQAQSNPVVLNIPNKVVYSLHEYPWNYSGNDQQYILQLDNAWGYLVRQNVAPVWIGEMGSSLASDHDRRWATLLTGYMNGADSAAGGPSFTAGQQGVSGDWWSWAGYRSGDPDGILQTNWKTLRQDQLAIVQQTLPGATQTTSPSSNSAGASGGADTLQIWMSEDAYNGDARFSVALDGTVLASNLTVTAANITSSVEPFTFSGPFGEGQHQLTITYLNDVSAGPGQDRNLDLKYLTWDGETVPTAGLHLNVTGSKALSFTTPAPSPATGSIAIFRFLDVANGEHFYTASPAEQDTILATRSDMHDEGVGFTGADPNADPSAVPVYRFLDTADGSHFFTSSQTERDTVIATRPEMTYEGTGFYEHAAPQSGDQPVYRFLDTANGSHFYTPSAQERDSVSSTRPDLQYEGISFYTPAPS